MKVPVLSKCLAFSKDLSTGDSNPKINCFLTILWHGSLWSYEDLYLDRCRPVMIKQLFIYLDIFIMIFQKCHRRKG